LLQSASFNSTEQNDRSRRQSQLLASYKQQVSRHRNQERGQPCSIAELSEIAPFEAAQSQVQTQQASAEETAEYHYRWEFRHLVWKRCSQCPIKNSVSFCDK